MTRKYFWKNGIITTVYILCPLYTYQEKYKCVRYIERKPSKSACPFTHCTISTIEVQFHRQTERVSTLMNPKLFETPKPQILRVNETLKFSNPKWSLLFWLVFHAWFKPLLQATFHSCTFSYTHPHSFPYTMVHSFDQKNCI